MDCLFCKIIAGEIPGDIVYEDDKVLAFNDINPVAPYHILVVPKKHYESILDVNAEDMDIIAHIHKVINIIAKEKGLEELQRVTRQRNLAGLRTLIDPRELDQDFRDATLQILDTVLIMSLIVLKDEFDFGTKRLDRFKKRFNDKTECLETGNVTWIDMIEQVREEKKKCDREIISLEEFQQWLRDSKI